MNRGTQLLHAFGDWFVSVAFDELNSNISSDGKEESSTSDRTNNDGSI